MEHHLLELSMDLMRLNTPTASALAVRLAYAWNKVGYLEDARIAMSNLANLRMSPRGSAMTETLESIGHALEAIADMADEAEREFDALHDTAHQTLGHEKRD